MTYAIIPPTPGYPELVTDIPARDQGSVEAGARAAELWMARPWDDLQPYYAHLNEVLPDRFHEHRDAFTAGYLGRIHQHLRTPRVAGRGQQLVSGSDELTVVLFNMLKDVAAQSSKGKLKAKSFQARDLMRRVEQLANAMHDVTDEVNGMAGGRHE
ncbi:hypothetical protein [Halomonas sp. JS92-SW72]|jgi:hypothetical protein|uniref:hypothetical protein n=1 Tax=Halomonas sp. JS92-SW72 TaxID=2306583 RepID=UPI000E5A8E9E|nr:hypothetical protein [Halomonas sp. JS92-SW72]AXY43913.1 hypothetical protein D1793_17915 [Halomonas sp. JS92-SW72]